MLHRQILYLSDHFCACSVVITDASDLQVYAKNKDTIIRCAGSLRVTHLDGRNKSFPERILECLGHVFSPSVILASDDDFIMPKWFEQATRHVSASGVPIILTGVVLSLNQRRVFCGKLGIQNSSPNPPYRYLGAVSPSNRLKEIAKSDWATAGWYAVQPTSCLLDIANLAHKYQLEGYTFERFLIFHQCLHCQTFFDSNVSHVRQVEASNRLLYETTQQKYNLLPFVNACCDSLLSKELKSGEDLFLLAYDAIQHELLHLRLNHKTSLGVHYYTVKYSFRVLALFRRFFFALFHPQFWMFDTRLPRKVKRSERVEIQKKLFKYIVKFNCASGL